jgi:hypothetical protein
MIVSLGALFILGLIVFIALPWLGMKLYNAKIDLKSKDQMIADLHEQLNRSREDHEKILHQLNFDFNLMNERAVKAEMKLEKLQLSS